MVWVEKVALRDVVLGSIVLSILAIVPPLLVMVVIDKVVTDQSMSTLTLIALFLVAAAMYETFLGFIRRKLIQVVATRLDTKLALHIFRRLLGLPIDYFERTQTGAVLYKLGQISKVRDFLAGRLLTTLLDLVTLVVMVPVLFWISVPLTWMVIGAAGCVLNNRPETNNPGAGLRPRFEGAISFSAVNFTYPGSRNPALNEITFEVPAGTIVNGG